MMGFFLLIKRKQHYEDLELSMPIKAQHVYNLVELKYYFNKYFVKYHES